MMKNKNVWLLVEFTYLPSHSLAGEIDCTIHEWALLLLPIGQ
jgi:hypothetical protein